MTGVVPYSPAILEHFRHPRNYGALPNATAEAEGVNPLCGDRIRLALLLDEAGTITEARFTANACAICVASASLLTEHLKEINSSRAGEMDEASILALVGSGVPPARRRCATLPLETLRRALASVSDAPMIAAVLLAAGNARRFDGTQKLLAVVPCGGAEMPLVKASASGLTQAGLKRIVVVLGRDGALVRQALGGLRLAFVQNADYESGVASSIRVGVAEAFRLWPNLAAVMIALGDQPLGGSGIVERLAEVFTRREQGRTIAIVAPRFRGAPGNPVVFAREVAPELLALSGDRGGRSIVDRDHTRVAYVAFDRDPPPDVDRVEDLKGFVHQS